MKHNCTFAFIFFLFAFLSFNTDLRACVTPTPVISGPVEACENSSEQYNVVNAAYYKSFSWKVTGGTITGSASDWVTTIQWHEAGTGLITIITSDTNNCVDSFTYSVAINYMPVLKTQTVSACAGDRITLEVPECEDCLYLWKDGRYPVRLINTESKYVVVARGSKNKVLTIPYLVQIIKGNCMVNDTVKLEVHPNARISINGQNSTIAGDTAAYLFYENIADSTNFNIEGGEIIYYSMDYMKIKWNDVGQGKIKFTGYLNECTFTDSFMVNVKDGTTSISEEIQSETFTVYPNPASNKLHISTTQKMLQPIIMYNILGEEVLKVELEPNGSAIKDVSNIPNGIYFLGSQNGSTKQKVIIAK